MNDEENIKRQNISIRLHGVPVLYLQIEPQNEEIYRKAAKLFNEKVEYYIGKLNICHSDAISLVAYEMAVNVCNLEANYHTTPLSFLSDLDKEIEEVLNNDKNDDK